MVFGHGGELAHLRGDGSQLGRRQVHIGVLTQTVGEVTCGGRHHSRAFTHLRLVTHAQRAAGHFSTCTGGAERSVVPLFDQLALVHLRRRCDPQLDGDVALTAKQLSCCAEVTNVGHARADEGFVDLGASHFRQELGVIRVVRAAHDGLFDLSQVNLDDVGIFRIFVSLEQRWRSQPLLDLLNSTRQGACVGITISDHVLHEHDVGLEVFLHRLFVELDRATRSRALGRRVRQFKRLFHFEVGQAFDFQNTARELVDLASLGHGQQTLLDRVQRNGVHQVAQGHARLHLAFETHQDGLGHVQRHHACGRTKRHQA